MDEDAKRQVLRRIPYGMYVMTAIADGRPAASTLTWMSQCSFHPPLLMIGVQTNSRVHEAVEASGAIAVNFLAEEQQDVAEGFFRPPSDPDGEHLHGLSWSPAPATGSPLLAGLPAWLEARVTDRVDRGDHTVYVCEVLGAGLRNPDFKPLVLSSTPWNYGG
jgi:flavin reductase (DIM6/NTAB) family NADH-FMN oxidoreductase RutF